MGAGQDGAPENGNTSGARWMRQSALLLLLGLAVYVGALLSRSLAQETACFQPAEDACPLVFGEPAAAALDEDGTPHRWRLEVASPGSFRVTLTALRADYDLEVLDPDGSVIGFSANEGTADEVIEVQPADAGDYLVIVYSSQGETSPAPYVLVAEFTPQLPAPLLVETPVSLDSPTPASVPIEPSPLPTMAPPTSVLIVPSSTPRPVQTNPYGPPPTRRPPPTPTPVKINPYGR